MTRAHRNINIAAVVLPFVAFLAAIPMLWNELVGPLDLVLLVTIYAVSTIGITVGYHRLLTHRAFATYKPVEYAYAILGSLAVEGPVIGWVSDHRKHHAHADEEGDPHSPHVDHHGETPGALRGLWHAHLGRPRPHLPGPPPHLLDQLDLPLLRPLPLPDRRQVDQRVLAGAAHVRRVLAPQPPRVPALRDARPPLV